MIDNNSTCSNVGFNKKITSIQVYLNYFGLCKVIEFVRIYQNFPQGQKVKNIVLCADDYGLFPEVDQGILELLDKKRLTAISCLVTSKHWPKAALALIPFKDKADIGLHLNFTEGALLTLSSSFSLKTLLLQASLRILPYKKIYEEIRAQYLQFCDQMGRAPDFIDGHQHVHVFPVIREALLQFIKDNKINKLYIRNTKFTNFSGKFGLKKAVIALSGGQKFAKLLKEHKIDHNQSFSGCYDFKNADHYRQLFLTFLNESKSQGLIMCHPGLESKADVLVASRKHEYNYLLSQTFLEDLDKCQVRLARFY